jgi:Putative peptidoglycan binding domain
MNLTVRLRCAALLAALPLVVLGTVFATPVGPAAGATAAPAAAKCHKTAVGSWAPNCTLKKGDRSRLVQATQLFIGSQEVCVKDFPNQNGTFSSDTKKGVECYQRFNGLKVTGTVDEQTWRSMYNGLGYYNTKKGWRYYYSTGVGDVDFRESVKTKTWEYGGIYAKNHWLVMNSAAPSGYFPHG